MGSSSALNSQELTRVQQVPNVVLPPEIESLGTSHLPSSLDPPRFHRGDKIHSSLRIPKKPPSKRRLCRHHSDSEARKESDGLPKRKTVSRRSSRKVRRSISAIETNKPRYKPRVRRSISERSGLLFAGRHLIPPRSRPHSMYDTHSSKCSSTKTLSSNVSISEIVAVELGFKEIPGLTPKEARRRRVVCTVMLVSVILLVLSVVLVALTLFLSPAVDEVWFVGRGTQPGWHVSHLKAIRSGSQSF
ncbi:uncharacterized protein NPIL_385181 [Nephila pilipes]|uniref:Uncharacterized protein n=1 Tax=Nephila pilipes TaxID=299642 RepID=A0A8X6QF57_NEPPI|nr:uncharacterized protein NPIL_385181 [Nephila pilipes]